MKKFLSLLLCLALVLSMTACGNKEEEKDNNQGGLDDIQIGVTDTPAPTSDVTAPTATDTPAPTGDEPVVTDAPVVRPSSYVRADDEDIYEQVLGGFTAYSDKAKAADSVDKRFVYFAQAEAYLLDSAVMIPTTTKGGAYTISRIAPRTVPYVQWGNDVDRLKGVIISDEFCTPEERADMLAEWAKAVAGEGTYDPAAYLISKGHTINTNYTTTFSTAPVTIDWLNTSSR